MFQHLFVIMCCVLGTEEETEGDGAGDVSMGIDSENVVRRRRAVVTKRLVPLNRGPSIVFVWPTQAKSYWRRHLMRVYFF